MTIEDKLEYFKIANFRCKCDRPQCKKPDKMKASFLLKVDKIRRLYFDTPLNVTSGHRCAAHDKAVGGSGANHPKGLAADVMPLGRTFTQAEKLALVCAAERVGIRRIVVYRAHVKSHIHLDDNPDLTPGLFVK